MGDIKKGKKKKRRKKKNNNNNENKINVDEIKENIENQRKLICDFVKNLIFEKLNKRLNECYEKEKNNKNKKVKNNKKEKEFYLYQSITKKNNKKGNEIIPDKLKEKIKKIADIVYKEEEISESNEDEQAGIVYLINEGRNKQSNINDIEFSKELGIACQKLPENIK